MEKGVGEVFSATSSGCGPQTPVLAGSHPADTFRKSGSGAIKVTYRPRFRAWISQ
jgi:hypothetical protein